MNAIAYTATKETIFGAITVSYGYNLYYLWGLCIIGIMSQSMLTKMLDK